MYHAQITQVKVIIMEQAHHFGFACESLIGIRMSHRYKA